MERLVPVFDPRRKVPLSIRLGEVPSLFSEGPDSDEASRAAPTSIRRDARSPNTFRHCEALAPKQSSDCLWVASPSARNDTGLICTAAQARDEEPVRVARQRRQPQPVALYEGRKRRQVCRGDKLGAADRGEIGPACQKRGDPVLILLPQQRAGDIDEPPAGLHETRGGVEHLVLLLDPLFERARPDAPFGVGVAPPGAGAGARRIDQHQIAARFEIGEHILMAARRADLDIAGAGAIEPRMQWREPPRLAVGRIDLAVVVHSCGERQGLAAAAGAKIKHLLAGLGRAEQRRQLRALVLDFDEAFDIGGLAGKRRAAAVVATESRGKGRRQPVRIIAAHGVRRAIERRRRKPRALIVGQSCRRMALAAAKRRDRIGQKAAHFAQAAEHDGARRLGAHDPGRRSAAAQGIKDQRRQRRAVLRAGKAMRKAPILQRIGGRTMPRLDIVQNFDRRGDPCTRIHFTPNSNLLGIGPDLRRMIRARCQRMAIRRIGDGGHIARMTENAADQPVGLGVPNANGIVRRARSDQALVGRDGDRPDRAGLFKQRHRRFKLCQQLSVGNAVDADARRLIAADGDPPVAEERQSVDRQKILGVERAQIGAVGSIQADAAAAVSGRKQA
ncbi:hypothetical protein GW17_00061653, partial [Ensete ventricosum]